MIQAETKQKEEEAHVWLVLFIPGNLTDAVKFVRISGSGRSTEQRSSPSQEKYKCACVWVYEITHQQKPKNLSCRNMEREIEKSATKTFGSSSSCTLCFGSGSKWSSKLQLLQLWWPFWSTKSAQISNILVFLDVSGHSEDFIFLNPAPHTDVSSHQILKDFGPRIIFGKRTNFVTPSEVCQNGC